MAAKKRPAGKRASPAKGEGRRPAKKKAAKKGVRKPRKKTPKKAVKKPRKKTPKKGVKKPRKKAPKKGVKKPRKKAPRKGAKKPRKKTPKKTRKKAPAERVQPGRKLRIAPIALKPIEVVADFEPLEITTHAALTGKQREIFRRIRAHPELSVLFPVNPVLALKEVQVNLGQEAALHLLQIFQHPPAVRKRREYLEKKLKGELKGAPQPEDPAWLAEIVFERLKLEPLATGGHKPVYKSPIDPESIKRLQALRPKRPPRKDGRPPTGTRIHIAFERSSVRRLDLDAELPELKKAARAPKKLTLEQLYFYKDAHPTARELLELGIIRSQAYPIQTPGTFRKIKKGERRNAFRGFVRSVSFRER